MGTKKFGRMGKALAVVLLGVTAAMASLQVQATAGAVNENGCHDSAKIGYHCHAQKGRADGNADNETKAQRDKRLRRECKGLQNAGVCAGYVKKP